MWCPRYTATTRVELQAVHDPEAWKYEEQLLCDARDVRQVERKLDRANAVIERLRALIRKTKAQER